jgi:hypothetical protein
VSQGLPVKVRTDEVEGHSLEGRVDGSGLNEDLLQEFGALDEDKFVGGDDVAFFADDRNVGVRVVRAQLSDNGTDGVEVGADPDEGLIDHFVVVYEELKIRLGWVRLKLG